MHIRSIFLAMLLAAGPAAAQNSWITASDTALRYLKSVAPGMVTVRASAMVRSGDAGIVQATEQVHLLEVRATDVALLSMALHHGLGHCGGFAHHASEADGLRTLARADAVPLAALGRPAYLIANQAVVAPMLAQMHEDRLAQTIVTLSAFVNRYYSSAHGAAASDWLKKTWAELGAGRDDISVEQFAHDGYKQQSVIATIRGSERGDEVLVLGAHLDSINIGGNRETSLAPGADDDASGVAGLTEVLRVMVASGYRPRRTIKLMGYAAEEVGLRGSQDIARDFKKRGVNVLGVLQLDMINYKGSTADITIFTDYTDSLQNAFLGRLIQAYLPALTVSTDKCGYACSDHASWNAQGYAASMPFESSMRQDNPHIHTIRDTFASSGNQAAHALKFTRLAAAFAVELGSEVVAPQPPAK
ncbi:M20/M25/M40 family metallo-hydrolase [Massilia glaciei]|uniref:Aminopeptidase n=1 Tax=Massilia glaciei TaxID=1524097 RepID=A0A2U2HH79_9BURK|nr:M20/M25/M40 family metallo-hydrolase [Massilia glaciei]PWF44984.1 aminopeptidase [Massilia glaciei]